MEIFRWAAKNPPKDPQVSFSGKTVLVTGSNTGLGYQAALKIAALDVSKLVLAVRSMAKGAEAKKKIVASTNCNEDTITIMQLDMSSFDSVKAFATQVEGKIDKLDIAVLNAGIAPPKYVANPSTGYESALQVNILSTALLAILLIPKLRDTASKTDSPSQLTITGSFAHQYVTARDLQVSNDEGILNKINTPEYFNAEKSYNVVKLLTMYVMQGLVDDYSKSTNGVVDVAIDVVCPGFCVTDLGRDFPWYIALPTKLMQMYYGRSAEEGSRSLVSATLLGTIGHGKFWTNDTLAEYVTYSADIYGLTDILLTGQVKWSQARRGRGFKRKLGRRYSRSASKNCVNKLCKWLQVKDMYAHNESSRKSVER